MGAHTRVFIDEEYGYRRWILNFRGSEEELERWWRGLTSVLDFWHNMAKACKEAKIGNAVELEDELEGRWLLIYKPIPYLHIHMDEDSYLVLPSDIRTGIPHKGARDWS